jgi:hypothetical protein
VEALADWLLYNWNRVQGWFKDDVFRRLFLNAGKLLSAHSIAFVLGFVIAALTARFLEPNSWSYMVWDSETSSFISLEDRLEAINILLRKIEPVWHS